MTQHPHITIRIGDNVFFDLQEGMGSVELDTDEGTWFADLAYVVQSSFELFQRLREPAPEVPRYRKSTVMGGDDNENDA